MKCYLFINYKIFIGTNFRQQRKYINPRKWFTYLLYYIFLCIYIVDIYFHIFFFKLIKLAFTTLLSYYKFNFNFRRSP